MDQLADLPGPKGLPVLGNFLQLDINKLHLILEGWADIYGGMYQFSLFHKTVVAISDPALIQAILRDRPATYRRGGAIDKFPMKWTYTGYFLPKVNNGNTIGN